MFPVHCAVLGGNIELLQWLVEGHLCPLVSKENRSVQTSASRTLFDLAMVGRPKVAILRYLVQKGMDINDVKDSALAPRTLQLILKAEMPPPVTHVIPHDASVTTTTLDDACTLCCEKHMDCVLIPCGHQLCCSDCGKQLSQCPTCKTPCQVLKVFRQ